MKKNKISILQTLLTVLFVGALLISNIISGRLINFFGNSVAGGIIAFPLTYILSDIFSEVYGYKWSRFTCYLGFAVNMMAVGMFYILSALPAYISEQAAAFDNVLISTFSCTMASFLAFVLGDFINDRVFAKMKKNHIGKANQKGFAARAIISSIAGEFTDSCIYMPLAFMIINPIMTVGQISKMIIINVCLKVLYEIIILPVTILIVKKVAIYENKK